MAKDDPDYYTYEMKKSLTGGFLKQAVAIRPSWISRTRRYAGATGLDIKKIYNFVNKGLIDRSAPGFNQKALDSELTAAQKWILLALVLQNGVPEWIRTPELDEKAPNLVVDEPEDEATGIIGKTVGVATTAATTAASAAKTATDIVTKPVKSAADMVKGANKAERGAPNPDSPFTQTEE